MPLVFATGAPTASGHTYADVLGKQYEFPPQYRGLVETGERFVYYRGRRGSSDGKSYYLGEGVVGDVSPSGNEGQFVALVHDVEMFDAELLAKCSDGVYLETGTTRGTNWASGVRRISGEAFERIAGAAVDPALPVTKRRSAASAEHATRLERYSMAVALSELRQEFGPELVEEMPPGNPGYDIVVHRPEGELHVEVKGTVLPDPVFHLSEGQRKHAELLGEDFRLMVVYDVQVGGSMHRLGVCSGPLTNSKVRLQTESWTGVLAIGNLEV